MPKRFIGGGAASITLTHILLYVTQNQTLYVHTYLFIIEQFFHSSSRIFLALVNLKRMKEETATISKMAFVRSKNPMPKKGHPSKKRVLTKS